MDNSDSGQYDTHDGGGGAGCFVVAAGLVIVLLVAMTASLVSDVESSAERRRNTQTVAICKDAGWQLNLAGNRCISPNGEISKEVDYVVLTNEQVLEQGAAEADVGATSNANG